MPLDIKSRKKENKRIFAINDILSGINKSLVEESTNLLNESISTPLKSFCENHKPLRNRGIYNEQCTRIKSDILAEAFANIVNLSVPIDSDKKVYLESEIVKLSKKVFHKLMDSKQLLEGCDEYNEYLIPFIESFSNVDKYVPEGKYGLLKESLNNFNFNKDFEIENILTESIYNKVTKVIVEEQNLAKNRKKILKEHKNFNSNTLFSSINMLTYKNLKNEESEKNSFELEETSEFKFSCLEEEALAKTVIYYTILESLNTLKLCNFDDSNINNDALSLVKQAELM